MTLKLKFDDAEPSQVSNQGDSEVLSCEWGDIIEAQKRVTWFRYTNFSGTETIWNYFGGKFTSQAETNVAASGYEAKFVSVKQTTHKRRHKIKLVNAQKEDEGRYWCVLDENGDISTSSAQLTVYVPQTTQPPSQSPPTSTTATTTTSTLRTVNISSTPSKTPITIITSSQSLETTVATIIPNVFTTTRDDSDDPTATEPKSLSRSITTTNSQLSSAHSTTPNLRITTVANAAADKRYQAPDGNGGLPIPLISGVAGGLVLVLVVVIVIIVVLRCKRKLNKDEETVMKENEYEYVGLESTVQNGSSGSTDHPKGTNDVKHKTTNTKTTLEDETELKDHNYSEINPMTPVQTTDQSPKTPKGKTPMGDKTEPKDHDYSDINPVTTLQQESEEKNTASDGKVSIANENDVTDRHYSEKDPASILQTDQNESRDSAQATAPLIEEPYSYVTHKQAQPSKSHVQYYNVVHSGHSKVQSSKLGSGKHCKDIEQASQNPGAKIKPTKQPDKRKMPNTKAKPKASKENSKEILNDSQEFQYAEVDIQSKKVVKQRKENTKGKHGPEVQCVKDHSNSKKAAQICETENDPETPEYAQVDKAKKKAVKEASKDHEQKNAEVVSRIKAAQEGGREPQDVTGAPRHKNHPGKQADKKTKAVKESSQAKNDTAETKVANQSEMKTHAVKTASQAKNNIVEKKPGKHTAKDSTNITQDRKGAAVDTDKFKPENNVDIVKEKDNARDEENIQNAKTNQKVAKHQRQNHITLCQLNKVLRLILPM